jgi:hypothetical protein
MDTVFNKRGSNSLERRLSIKRFASNLLNPRKEQAIYTDIFTGKHVNADAQGAVNVARSYLFSLSDVYDETVKGVDRLKCWQDWYIQTLTNIPSFLYTCEDKQA